MNMEALAKVERDATGSVVAMIRRELVAAKNDHDACGPESPSRLAFEAKRISLLTMLENVLSNVVGPEIMEWVHGPTTATNVRTIVAPQLTGNTERAIDMIRKAGLVGADFSDWIITLDMRNTVAGTEPWTQTMVRGIAVDANARIVVEHCPQEMIPWFYGAALDNGVTDKITISP